jgi:quinolinate synthase
MTYSERQIINEADRLFEKLGRVKRPYELCLQIAPTTLRINQLKEEQDAIILAHSYQIPEIMYGVADFIGDSYGLAKIAKEHEAKKIIFCSVHFMGETAKILSPDKEVVVPEVAGCSLAESINAEDVRKLKAQHLGVPVVCYVNTTAEVKAESDVCCTSSNALKIIDALDSKEAIFIPDKLMGKNLQNLTNKKLILWDGTCIVHEQFDLSAIERVKSKFPETKILVHYECTGPVVDIADLVGSTSDILNYVDTTDAEQVMLVTECGITDRVKAEYKDKQIVGTCQLCPYMKQVTLESVLQSLVDPQPEQIVTIPDDILLKAKETLNKMMDYSKAL